MIATAIEIDDLNAALSSRFGKAKYYAFFDGETLKIEKNPHHNGIKLIEWLIERGVTKLLMKEQDRKPCALKENHNIRLLYPGSIINFKLKDMVRLYFQIEI